MGRPAKPAFSGGKGLSRETRKGEPRLIAVLPIYNEARTLEDVLRRVSRWADHLVLVNDGSKDETKRILNRFVRARPGAYRVTLPLNRGMAAALEAGFRFVLFLRDEGLLSENDVVVTLDADGQHQPEYLPEGKRRLIEGGWDVLLTYRDFSVYPLYKILGNRFLTFTNSLLSGFPYRDVESGMRFLKVSALKPILRYFTGIRYSCAQEIALLSALQGLRVSNDFRVEIAYYRPGTTVKDGFVVLALSVTAFLRHLFGVPVSKPDDTPLYREALRASRRKE
jgi:glycosyltransferase involved in cell wall biosynthesis